MILPDELAGDVTDYLAQGHTQDDASAKFGISKGSVNKLARGTWRPTKHSQLEKDAVGASRKRYKKEPVTYSLKFMMIPSASMGVWVRSETTDVTQQRELMSYLPRTHFGKIFFGSGVKFALLDAGGNIGLVSKFLSKKLDPDNKFLQHRVSEPLVENLHILVQNNTDRSIEIFDAALIGDTDTRVQAEMALPTTMYNKYRGCLIEHSSNPHRKERITVATLRWSTFLGNLNKSVGGIYLKFDCEGAEEHLPLALRCFLPQAPFHLKFIIAIGELSYDNHPTKGTNFWTTWLCNLKAIPGWALLEQTPLRGNPGLNENSFTRRCKCVAERCEWVLARKHS